MKRQLLSLQKVYNIEEIRKWMLKVSRTPDEKFVVMPKYDGIAGRLLDGKLASRGDGTEGESLTHHKNRVKVIDVVCDEDMDGEILITKKDFELYFGSGGKYEGKYKNSRNAISGIMGSKENPFTEQVVTMVGYDHITEKTTVGGVGLSILSVGQQMLDYPTDGFVVKLEDDAYAETLGHTTHHYKHSMALKHANTQATTVLKGVEFRMAKDHIGIIGLLEPIDINGVTISRVTLHNMDIIRDLDLHVGDTVVIERAGDVIPYIVDSYPTVGYNKAYRDLTHIELVFCPSCGTDVVLDKQFYKCSNDECSGKNQNKIEYGARLFGLKHIAGATIEKLYETKVIRDVVDFLSCTSDDFFQLEGFGEVSAKKAQKEIEKVPKEVGDYQILAALCIPGIGRSISKKILAHVTLDKLVGLDLEDMSKFTIPDVGQARLEALDRGVKTNTDLLYKLAKHFPNYTNTKDNEETVSIGSICFTGKMPEKRSFYENIAKEAGFEIGAVNKNLNTLVVSDPNSTSSKTQKAQKLGISIMSVDEFMNMFDKEK